MTVPAPMPPVVPSSAAVAVGEWSTPRRLHPLSFVVGLLREVRKLLYLVVAVFLGRSLGSGEIDGALIPVVIALLGVVVWLTTKFRVTDEEVRIDSGILARNHRTARFDRIQAIDIDQPLVARVFGLAELHIQIAGGRQGHFRLACLRQAEAARLRAHLLERCAEVAAHAPHAAPSAVPAPAVQEHRGQAPYTQAADTQTSYTQTPHAQTPYTQTPYTQTSYTQPPWPTAAAWQPPPTAYGDGVPYGHTADEWPVVAVPTGMFIGSLALSPPVVLSVLVVCGAVVTVVLGAGAALAGGFGPILLAVGGYAYNRFARYFGFTLTLSADGVRLRHGLTNRFAQTIPYGRIQAIEISEPFLWRRFGWARLRMNVAGYAHGGGRGESGQRHVSYLLPVAPREVAWQVAAHLSGTDPRTVALTPAPRRAALRSGPWRRGDAFGCDATAAVTRRGLIGRTHTVIRYEKTQSLRYRQGPWQRALRVATVSLHSTRGPVRATARNGDAAALEAYFADVGRLCAQARRNPVQAAPPVGADAGIGADIGVDGRVDVDTVQGGG